MLDNSFREFERILAILRQSDAQVGLGRMMNAPAIVYRSKVFAFYHRGEMGFRAGRDFDPAIRGIREWRYLNPFKNKLPMRDWIVLPPNEGSSWLAMARIARSKMMKDLRSEKPKK